MLTSLLRQLESFLIENDYPIIKKLNTGIAEEEINGPLKEFNLGIPRNLIELYTWRNGVPGLYEGATTEELELFSTGIMFPFEQAVETYIREALEEKYFKNNYFPIFTNGEDYLLADLEKKRPSEGLFIYSPSLFISKPMTIYDSMEKLFETVLLTYQNQGYYFSGNNLETDYEIETAIATELNPKSKFWKD